MGLQDRGRLAVRSRSPGNTLSRRPAAARKPDHVTRLDVRGWVLDHAYIVAGRVVEAVAERRHITTPARQRPQEDGSESRSDKLRGRKDAQDDPPIAASGERGGFADRSRTGRDDCLAFAETLGAHDRVIRSKRHGVLPTNSATYVCRAAHVWIEGGRVAIEPARPPGLAEDQQLYDVLPAPTGSASRPEPHHYPRQVAVHRSRRIAEERDAFSSQTLVPR